MPVSPPLLFLIVEDDLTLSRTLARFLSEFGDAQIASSVAAAEAAMPRAATFAGLLVDVGLGDGSGLEWLGRARAAGLRAPAMVLTAQRDADVIAGAQLTDAYYLPKPPREANLRAFVERCKSERTRAHVRLREDVRAYGLRHALSPREDQALMLAASGVPRCDLAGALGVEETTTKTLVRNLLRKTHQCALADVVGEIHRNVFGELDG